MPPTVTDLARRVRLLTVAVAALSLGLAGILVFVAGPPLAGLVLPPPAKSTAACTAFPQAGFNYYVYYNLTTGEIGGGLGTTGPPPTANNSNWNGGRAGVANITAQPGLVHNIFCWWWGGSSGQTPWHVNLATGEVLPTPQPAPPIPSYLWLDPTIVALSVGGFIAWRLLPLHRPREPPNGN